MVVRERAIAWARCVRRARAESSLVLVSVRLATTLRTSEISVIFVVVTGCYWLLLVATGCFIALAGWPLLTLDWWMAITVNMTAAVGPLVDATRFHQPLELVVAVVVVVVVVVVVGPPLFHYYVYMDGLFTKLRWLSDGLLFIAPNPMIE